MCGIVPVNAVADIESFHGNVLVNGEEMALRSSMVER